VPIAEVTLVGAVVPVGAIHSVALDGTTVCVESFGLVVRP
jgi:hypothetical protein